MLELSENYSQFYGNKVRLRFNAQVPLPNLNRHLSAFIGRDDNDDFIQDRFDNSTLRNNFPNVDDHEKVFAGLRSEEHTSELRSLMRISYAVFCLKKKKIHQKNSTSHRSELTKRCDTLNK